MKQFQYVDPRTGIIGGPYGDDEVQELRREFQAGLAKLAVGDTWLDGAGDWWERLPDSDSEHIRVEHLPGETVVYVPADRLERIATAVTEGMVNTIRTEDDYQRIRALAADRGMSVSQWIACDAVKQANALIAELDKQA